MQEYKIGFIGLWHLGLVYSNVIASITDSIVLAYDKKQSIINNLKKEIPPIFEPELNDLISSNLLNKKIEYIEDPEKLNQCDFIWITLDTELDENSDKGKYELVLEEIYENVRFFKKNIILIISSQIPIGVYGLIKKKLNDISRSDIKVAISPENLRLGSSIPYLKNPDRLVFGIAEQYREKISSIFPNNYPLFFVSPNTALLTKHVINSFLATSVAFANEIGSIAKKYGVNTSELTKSVKSDSRIGAKAYLQPGEAFGGGTLGRDVNYLCKIAHENNLELNLIKNIIISNEEHKLWPFKLIKAHKKFPFLKVLILGATYKEGTDTLRKSNSFSLAESLNSMKVRCTLCDNLSKERPCVSLEDVKNISNQNWDIIMVTKNNTQFKEFLEELEHSNKICLIDLKGDYFYLSDKFLEYNSLTSG